MPKISAVFCDVGGVLLTNGWDHGERARLVEKFGLDGSDFEDRHQMLSAAFDAGNSTSISISIAPSSTAPAPFANKRCAISCTRSRKRCPIRSPSWRGSRKRARSFWRRSTTNRAS